MLNISGIPVKVCKKKIRNLHLHVKHGSVSVSAPLSMSNETIEWFVRTKTDWIKKQIARFNNLPPQTTQEYVTGETLNVWGKPYHLQTEYGDRNSLVLSEGKATLTVRKAEQRGRFVQEWYREQLKAEIARQLPKWEKTTGLKASDWKTKNMKTRWGTCNTRTGRIWLNLQLAKKPPECLEYVILHELVHLTEKHHNERFFSLMDSYMPGWREVKVRLNERNLNHME